MMLYLERGANKLKGRKKEKKKKVTVSVVRWWWLIKLKVTYSLLTYDSTLY